MENNSSAVRGSSGVRRNCSSVLVAFVEKLSMSPVSVLASHYGTDPDQTVPTQPKADL